MERFKADKDLQPLVQAIATGDDPAIIGQLIKKSREPSILKYTPNDAAVRFRDLESFKEWKSGGRDIYWLLGEGDDLAGIIWYGRKEPAFRIEQGEQPDQTFAIRIYEGYSGHGLAVPAMRQTLRLRMQALEERGETTHGIWLETDDDNPAALKVYNRFGYHEIRRGNGRVTMVLPAREIPAAIKGSGTA